MDIIPGTVFSTDFESGCIAAGSPDELGNFEALDSGGVLCVFNTIMVLGHPDHRMPVG